MAKSIHFNTFDFLNSIAILTSNIAKNFAYFLYQLKYAKCSFLTDDTVLLVRWSFGEGIIAHGFEDANFENCTIP